MIWMILIAIACLIGYARWQARQSGEMEESFARQYPELAAGDHDAPEVRAILRAAGYYREQAEYRRAARVTRRRVASPKPRREKAQSPPVAIPALPALAPMPVSVPAPAPVAVSMPYVPPVPACAGNRFAVMTATGIPADGEYILIEAEDIIASHRLDLSRNTRHNAAYQGRRMDSQARAAKVKAIEASLNPLRYLVDIPIPTEGPTLVDAHNMTLGGNARCIAIQRRYAAGTNEAFRLAVIDRAPMFGLSPDDAARLSHPVIVRRVLTVFASEAAKEQFARDTDVPETQNRSAAELARADAEKIDADMMKLFCPDDDGDLNAVSNARFIQSLMARIGSSEWQGMTDAAGLLSQDGQRRFQAAVMYKAYGDSSLIEKAFVDTAGESGRNLIAGLLAVAPILLQACPERGRFIGQVARQFLDLKNAGARVLDYCDNLFFDETGNLQAVAPDAAGLLRLFDGARSKRAMIASLRGYLRENAGEGSGMEVTISMFSDRETVQFGAQARPLAEVGKQSDSGNLFGEGPAPAKEEEAEEEAEKIA